MNWHTPTWHQSAFFITTLPETALCTGFAGGKSWILVLRMMATKIQYPTIDLCCISPTHSILRDTIYPLVAEILEGTGIPYRVNKSENNIIVGKNGCLGKILCRSADDPGKIVGFTVGDIFIDEIDTLSAEKADHLWVKALGRMRAKFPDGKRNQIFCVSTPEGHRWLWKHFQKEVEQNPELKKSRKLIKASTLDNPYLPDGFVETLLSNYSPELVAAYLNGEFVNMNSGAVYKHYDPDIHSTKLTVNSPSVDVLYSGQDFNYDGSVSIVLGKVDDCLFALKEIVSKDTKNICENFKKLQLETKNEKPIIIYPDSSGIQRTTNSSQTDIAMLKQAGHRVKAWKKNPDVRDRINSVNALFSHNRLYVNQEQCPELHAALLQQTYNSSTGQPEKSNRPASIDDFNDSLGYVVHGIFPLKHQRMKYRTLGGL